MSVGGADIEPCSCACIGLPWQPREDGRLLGKPHPNACRFADMCVDMCIYMCICMCIDMCMDMCTDMCTDMCIEMCIDNAQRRMQRHASGVVPLSRHFSNNRTCLWTRWAVALRSAPVDDTRGVPRAPRDMGYGGANTTFLLCLDIHA